MNEQVFLLREVEKKVFLMHELVKFQTKTVPWIVLNSTKKKMVVFTLHEQVFLLHKLYKNQKKGVPNARIGLNFKQSLYHK